MFCDVFTKSWKYTENENLKRHVYFESTDLHAKTWCHTIILKHWERERERERERLHLLELYVTVLKRVNQIMHSKVCPVFFSFWLSRFIRKSSSAWLRSMQHANYFAGWSQSHKKRALLELHEWLCFSGPPVKKLRLLCNFSTFLVRLLFESGNVLSLQSLWKQSRCDMYSESKTWCCERDNIVSKY